MERLSADRALVADRGLVADCGLAACGAAAAQRMNGPSARDAARHSRTFGNSTVPVSAVLAWSALAWSALAWSALASHVQPSHARDARRAYGALHCAARLPNAGMAATDAAGRLSAVRRRAGVVLDCLSFPAPLPPQLGPIFKALPDLALEAAFGRIVELPAAELLRKIILAGKGIRRVVIVFVA
jgi:hypothetical protein